MAVYGKYQVYYGKIKAELEHIKEEYGYSNLSKAFAHWYLLYCIKMDDQDIAETIIDGNGDNGIDAILIDGESMVLYQFKFPDKEKNIENNIENKDKGIEYIEKTMDSAKDESKEDGKPQRKNKLEYYKAIGINRISIGMQSSSDEELKTLGRIHNYEDFLKTYQMAKDAGFENISVDVMYALPGQTFSSFEKTLRKTAELSPAHISAYSLIVEEGTPFDDMDLDLPGEETERKMYVSVGKILKEYGYHQYEISNYAKDGFECRHNSVYWKRGEYLGFGLSAASLTYDESGFSSSSRK